MPAGSSVTQADRPESADDVFSSPLKAPRVQGTAAERCFDWWWPADRAEPEPDNDIDFLASLEDLPRPWPADVTQRAIKAIAAGLKPKNPNAEDWPNLVGRCLADALSRPHGELDPPDPELMASDSGSTHSSTDAIAFQLGSIEWPLFLAAIAKRGGAADESETLLEEVLPAWTLTLNRWLDGDGLPHTSIAGQYGQLVASWTRCFAWLELCGQAPDEETRSHLEWIVRQTLRSLRPDGTLSGGPSKTTPVDAGFGKALLAMSQDRDDRRLARELLPFYKHASDKAPAVEDPSVCSEWGRTANLRSSWSHRAFWLTTRFGLQRCWLEFGRRNSLIAGDATPQISVDGRTLAPAGEFDVVCWHSDKDADVLELEVELEEGWLLQRQIVLAREDGFVVIGDAVCAPPDATATAEYRCRFPLAPGIQTIEESETSEVYLGTPAIQGLLLPLSVSEWKSERSVSRRLVHSDAIEIQHTGRQFWSGIWFDLKPRRCRRPRTWRSLTVAESRAPVPPETAVAFRVRSGNHQWVLYRSLAAVANRTFLGQNRLSEFFIGRLDKKGDAEPLVEIE